MAVINWYVYKYISYFQMATHASMAKVIPNYYGTNKFIMLAINGTLNYCTRLLTTCQLQLFLRVAITLISSKKSIYGCSSQLLKIIAVCIFIPTFYNTFSLNITKANNFLMNKIIIIDHMETALSLKWHPFCGITFP